MPRASRGHVASSRCFCDPERRLGPSATDAETVTPTRRLPRGRNGAGAPRPAAAYAWGVDRRERHLKLLTDTIEAVNSTLDLEQVLSQVARKVADAFGADACFVYLFDEQAASSCSGRRTARAWNG